MLISDCEVTVPGLFVNHSMGLNGRIGLVGYWGVVAFDEFSRKRRRVDVSKQNCSQAPSLRSNGNAHDGEED